MRHLYKIFLMILVIIFYIPYYSSGHLFSNAYSQNSNLVFLPGDKPYNQTFNKWVEEWFNWFLSIGDINGGHPRNSYSPEKCSWNQTSGPVWNLADGADRANVDQPEIRECKVPAGKALLVQIVGSNCSTVEGYKNEQELRNCAVWILDRAIISASIDGTEIMNTIKNPTDKDKFYIKPFDTNVTYAPHNIYGYKPGTYPGMEAGYFLFVKPLKPGNHQIEFKEIDENCPEGILAPTCDKRDTHVLYLLNVV